MVKFDFLITATKYKNEFYYDVLTLISFFKINLKIILFFSILGAMLGATYGKFAEPKYIGTLVIQPAQIANTLIIDSNFFLTQTEINSFFSDELLLACNLNDNKAEIKKVKISKVINPRVDRSGKLLVFSVEGGGKSKIINCLDLLKNEIEKKQEEIAAEYIEKNKKKITLLQKDLKLKKEIIAALTETIVKKEKLSGTEQITLNETSLNSNLNIDLLIKIYKTQTIEDLKNLTELTLQIDNAKKVIPIDIRQKEFPSIGLGLLLGLILGFSIGCIISILNIAIKIKDKK
jgi:hypothetical protein